MTSTDMAVQEVVPSVPFAGKYEPRNEVIRQVSNKGMQAPSVDNNSHGNAESGNSAVTEAPTKADAIVQSQRSDSLDSDKPSSISIHRSEKAWVSQFRPFGRLASSQADQPRVWRTTFLRFGPLAGLLAILTASASMIASLGILAGSDGRPVSEWSVSPSIYIAIFTAIANLSMRYAAIQGVVIAWWVKALRGSTLARLHWDWRSGTTLKGALTAGRHMGLLGLACIFSTVVVIDGPLLQRSTSVISVSRTNQIASLNVTMAPELPTGLGSTWSHMWEGSQEGSKTISTWTEWFNATIPTPNGNSSNYLNADLNTLDQVAVAYPWYHNSPIAGIVQGCPGECRAKIKAPAFFPTTCISKLSPINILHGSPATYDVFMDKHIPPPLDQDAFLISLNLAFENGKEVLNMITAYSTANDCVGTLNTTICTLESGIGEYDVAIQNDVVTLDTESAIRPKLMSLANNTAVNHKWDAPLGYVSTIAGVTLLAHSRWTSLGFYYPLPGNQTQVVFVGRVPSAEYMVDITKTSDCPSFRDPRDDVLESINRLMIYFGAHAAHGGVSADAILSKMDAGLSVNTTTLGYAQEPQNVFKTHYWFFLGAVIVELVCIALVAPTYWGWWTLGRPVSFSPLETAKAFESPLFAECNSNSSGRDLANAVGEQRVRYGAASADAMGQTTKLAFANPDCVSSAAKGSRFDV